MGDELEIGDTTTSGRAVGERALRVWVVDDDASIRWLLERALRREGMTPRSFDAATPALEALHISRVDPDVLITDIKLPGTSGLDLLRHIREIRPTLPVIVITGYTDLENVVATYKGGAFEYIPKPFDIEHIISMVRRAAASVLRADAEANTVPVIPEIIGKAPPMQEVFRAVGRLARSCATVLITGESGTGKELVARALHSHGPCADGPFIPLNTSSIAPDLLESELLGRESEAAKGTIFLDEIGDMPLPMQTQLLRLLAEGEFYRVGGSNAPRATARIIAATHRNLAECVKQGTFREDLYHRLNVIQIQLPPLRARPEDIPTLLQHYFEVSARELGIEPKTLAKGVPQRLLSYPWPGNVRELVNLCMRLSVLAPATAIQVADLPLEYVTGEAATLLDADWARSLRTWADRAAMTAQGPLLEEALPRFERALIGAALKRTRGHRREAAELLGWGRNTLSQKIRDLGMSLAEPGESAVPERTQ